MKRLFIISLLFLSVGLSQQKWNMEFMREYGGVTYAPNSDKPYTGSVFSLDSLGTKKEEGKYRNGLKDGRWTYYTTVGNGKYEITYKAGIYTLAVFTDKLGTDYTGSPITDEPEQDGTFLYQDEDKYDFSKYPMGFGTFKDGKPDGLMTGWYPHGQKWREETFKDGQKDGLWIEWHENGQKRLEGNYKDGKQDGLWTYWYENGPKKEEGTWKDGKQDGKHTQWDEKGIKTVIDYDNSICIRTKFGEIVVVLFYDVAPKHVESFKLHVQNGYFDNSIFHRVIPGFVIQGGDPNSKSEDRTMHGMGGHAAKYFGIGNEADSTSWMLPAEFNDSLHTRGILSMARAQDPNSGGSQFFVCVADVPQLDHQYTVFGRVVQGMEFVDMIVNSPRDGRDNPHERIEMQINICGENLLE